MVPGFYFCKDALPYSTRYSNPDALRDFFKKDTLT